MVVRKSFVMPFVQLQKSADRIKVENVDETSSLLATRSAPIVNDRTVGSESTETCIAGNMIVGRKHTMVRAINRLSVSNPMAN